MAHAKPLELHPGLAAFAQTAEGRTIKPHELAGLVEFSRNEQLLQILPGGWRHPDGSFANPHAVWLRLLTLVRTLADNLTEERKAELEVMTGLSARANAASHELGLALCNVVLLESSERDHFRDTAVARSRELRELADRVEALFVDIDTQN